MTNKPWDARVSAWLVRPLVNTPVHPNVLTTLRLVVGLWGAVLFASGTAFNLGALFIVLSNFLDHSDGELARMSGKTSRFGHHYDLLSDAVVTVGLFVGLGFGLRDTVGSQTLLYGAIAGLAVAGIFQLRHSIEQRHGKLAVKQASAVGFETEDILYLLPLVTLTDQQSALLHAAAIGAPIALLIVVVQYLKQADVTNRPS
jgi:archaetidylinositol phosphate synthase